MTRRAMVWCGIDPGTERTGVVIYDSGSKAALWACKDICNAVLVSHLRNGFADIPVQRPRAIAIERMQAHRMVSGDVIETTWVSGRFYEAAQASHYRKVVRYYRREILAALDVTGKGTRDSLVRQRLIEMHCGKTAAIGKKATPGALYGVTSHAWQALAVAVVAAQLDVRGARA